MDVGFIFGSSVSIWDMDENEKVKIGIKMCRDLSIVPIYGPCGMENCIMVLIKFVNEECEQWKLFCLVPSARYCGSAVGIEVFWFCKC
jgi:hypothetical protein